MNYYESTKNVCINNHQLTLTLKEFKLTLFMLIEPHVQVAPMRALQENMSKLFDSIEDFCYMEKSKKKLKGAKQAQLTRELSKLGETRDFWLSIYTRKFFIQKFYQTILSMEGYSLR